MLTLTSLVAESASFVSTDEFRHGLLVEIGGLVVEIALLAVAVPIGLHLWNRRRVLSARVLQDFYVFQLHHRVLRGLLVLLNVAWASDSNAERSRAKDSFIPRASTYGNLGDVISAARRQCVDRAATARILGGTDLSAFGRYFEDVRWSRNEIDRIVLWLHGHQALILKLNDLRVGLYVLEDKLAQEVLNPTGTGSASLSGIFVRRFDPADFASLLDQLTAQFEHDFLWRRRLVDRRERTARRLETLKLVASVIVVIPGRPLLIAWARWRGVPYSDRWGANSILPSQVRNWRASWAFSDAEAATALDLPERDYRDYENGYRQPEGEHLERILERLADDRERTHTAAGSTATE